MTDQPKRPYLQLGARLRAARLPLTQLQLAERLYDLNGADYPSLQSLLRQISRWEGGYERPGARWQRLYVLALEISDFDLFGEHSKAPPLEALLEEPPVALPAGSALRLENMSAAHVEELLAQIRQHWHVLVRIDNLLGPRHALDGVVQQLRTLTTLLRVSRPPLRDQVLSLAAQYGESAAWLHEDAGALLHASRWTGQTMEWAIEAGDDRLLAWTLFRRSQQARAEGNPAAVISLAAAARRNEGRLPNPMRAAILQQEAQGYALDGEERTSQALIDQAHALAARNDPGDASGGHGGFCTPAYLEMMRGACWLNLGRPAHAVGCYRTALADIPAVYRRDHAVANAGLAAAHTALDEPEQAAHAAIAALNVARSAGSTRIVNMVLDVNKQLAGRRHLEPVNELADMITSSGRF